MMRPWLFCSLAVTLLFAGCGSDESSAADDEQANDAETTDAREQELRKTAALDAIGVDGAQVRERLEDTIEQVEQRQQEAAEAAE